MDKLYEVREKCVRFFNRYEVYIQPVIKMIVALLLFYCINSRWGYMRAADHTVVYLALSLSCCILPPIAILAEAAGLVLLHLYALSPAVCVVAAGIFFLMYIFYYRFEPDEGLYTALTPISYVIGIPYIMPIAAGFFKKPYQAVSLVCGTVFYYFLDGIRKNEGTLGAASSKNTIVSKIHALINQLMSNKEMFLFCIAMILTVCVVYFIRRLSVDYAWTLALWIGAAVEFITILVGDSFFGINKKIVPLLVSCLIAIGIGWVMKFFCFHLDYARTERAQFEDDEYYYYVKAVPKILYPIQTKKKKKTKKSGKK